MPAQASAPSQPASMASPEAQKTGAAPAEENQVGTGTEKMGAPAPPYRKSWLARHFSLLRRDRQAQKAGQLFSGLLALNVVFLGGAFICSMIFNNVAVTLGDVWILLAALKALSLLWLLYYATCTTRHTHAMLFRDPHAGSIWVRGSLVLFGSCAICLNVFRVGYDVSHIHCKSQLELIFPVIEIVFIGAQTWVLWKHCKDCVQVQTNFTRCGLMLTLATNLLLWVLAVTNDSMHREIKAELSALVENFSGNDTNTCVCLNATVCEVFQKGYLMLYPFSTEYCLICCAVLFVMWKNVGRRLAPHTDRSKWPRHRTPILHPLLCLLRSRAARHEPGVLGGHGHPRAGGARAGHAQEPHPQPGRGAADGRGAGPDGHRLLFHRGHRGHSPPRAAQPPHPGLLAADYLAAHRPEPLHHRGPASASALGDGREAGGRAAPPGLPAGAGPGPAAGLAGLHPLLQPPQLEAAGAQGDLSLPHPLQSHIVDDARVWYTPGV
ncbi:proton channel OTOP3 isoform X3 [Panthera onca]|uniref:proton channel OTOP3 isoform X3 n=1 Tax=Panthera onca TaxID=9690 RepID=UPI002955CBC4|nr:proton channel OTOP3 isoform X3 [Panthera onca]